MGTSTAAELTAADREFLAEPRLGFLTVAPADDGVGEPEYWVSIVRPERVSR
jgi:hypothetical protein